MLKAFQTKGNSNYKRTLHVDIICDVMFCKHYAEKKPDISGTKQATMTNGSATRWRTWTTRSVQNLY